jgi:predicted nucleic acid-binding protein
MAMSTSALKKIIQNGIRDLPEEGLKMVADFVLFIRVRLAHEKENFSVINLDLEVIRQAFQIKDIPELHDRLIAATAAVHGIPLLSNDPAIEKSGSTKTIWE